MTPATPPPEIQKIRDELAEQYHGKEAGNWSQDFIAGFEACWNYIHSELDVAQGYVTAIDQKNADLQSQLTNSRARESELQILMSHLRVLFLEINGMNYKKEGQIAHDAIVLIDSVLKHRQGSNDE